MITLAKQNGSYVDVYDEKGSRLWSRSGELVGFTANTVAIKNGSFVDVYDEKGNRQFTR